MIREYIIKISDEIMEEEISDRPQELVRCKDCKHGRQYEPNCVDCEYRELATSPDWFCDDGERKSD